MAVFPQIERLFWFHDQVKCGRFPNAGRLAEQFEISNKTAQRDITRLRDRLRAPMEYDAGRKGYYYTDDHFELPYLPASQQEILCLLLARKVMSQSAEGYISREIGSLLDRLCTAGRLSGLTPQIAESAFSATWIGYSPALEPVFRQTAFALLKHQLVRFTYRSPATDKLTMRTAEPHHLQHYMASWVLTADNEIIEILPNNERRARFIPTSAADTPGAMNSLCEAFRLACENERIPRLLTIAACVFDLLCIHPFRDGNGRVSRLATTLLLVQEDFPVGRFISLERIVEQRKNEYYQVLERCSRGWHNGKNDIAAWLNFFLSILRNAYGELAEKVERTAATAPKGDMVRRIINEQVGPFALSEVAAQVPGVSLALVKRVLGAMKKEGLLKVAGRGRGAVWEVVRRS